MYYEYSQIKNFNDFYFTLVTKVNFQLGKRLFITYYCQRIVKYVQIQFALSIKSVPIHATSLQYVLQ